MCTPRTLFAQLFIRMTAARRPLFMGNGPERCPGRARQGRSAAINLRDSSTDHPHRGEHRRQLKNSPGNFKSKASGRPDAAEQRKAENSDGVTHTTRQGKNDE